MPDDTNQIIAPEDSTKSLVVYTDTPLNFLGYLNQVGENARVRRNQLNEELDKVNRTLSDASLSVEGYARIVSKYLRGISRDALVMEYVRKGGLEKTLKKIDPEFRGLHKELFSEEDERIRKKIESNKKFSLGCYVERKQVDGKRKFDLVLHLPLILSELESTGNLAYKIYTDILGFMQPLGGSVLSNGPYPKIIFQKTRKGLVKLESAIHENVIKLNDKLGLNYGLIIDFITPLSSNKIYQSKKELNVRHSKYDTYFEYTPSEKDNEPGLYLDKNSSIQTKVYSGEVVREKIGVKLKQHLTSFLRKNEIKVFKKIVHGGRKLSLYDASIIDEVVKTSHYSTNKDLDLKKK